VMHVRLVGCSDGKASPLPPLLTASVKTNLGHLECGAGIASAIKLVTLLQVSSLGDVKSSLGDAKSPLGDAKSSLGDAKSSLGDAKSSLGDAERSLGDAESSLGDAESSLGDG
jgi:hypothetical protein